MTEEYEDLDDDYPLECTWCGGEGFFFGSDTPGFDWINDDENALYDCPACRGSGDRKDQTLF